MKSPTTNAGFIRKGLQLLKTEYRESFSELCQFVNKIPGQYDLDDERITIFSDGGNIQVSGLKKKLPTRIKAQISSESILAVVDGTYSFEQILEMEKLVVFADPDSLLILNDALDLVIRTGIWSSVLQKHFDKYRVWVSRKKTQSQTKTNIQT